ncbi:MAG TPA: hypothetical protein VMV57_04435 [Terracidiphilus sp.]|nr:hypothetical protein [Terracidiphilus sp.]
MKSRLYVRIGSAAGAILVVGALALAQSKPASKTAKPHHAASQQSAGVQNQSGHAKAIAVDHAGGNGVRSMDRGHSGDNSLQKSNGKAASKSARGASATPQYKDPEDMTTRYRPGNNKTTAKSPATPRK